MQETFEISNLEEQNAEGIEDSLEDIESNMNAVVSFVPQLGEQELREPYIGMEFQSLDTGFKFYLDYAHRNGFSVRKNRISRSRKDKSIIGQEFVCSKEGFRSKKCLESNKQRDETREGCKVMIYMSKKEEEKWVIARLVLNHNHELASPNSQKFLRSKRKKSEAQKNLIDLLNNSGIRPSKIASVLTTQAGGIENLNITGRDIQNYLSTKRQNCLEKGDAQLMLKYFQKRQSDSPGFFYAIQMDVEGHLANCFWVDARSRIAYKNFGDVVLFDPTYLTNKYKMPFVPFTGVNNHHQSILFGCSLLWDETEETFQWLLHTWQEAMFGISPRTIITDQDAAITNAVAKVFPNSAHHFCMWHIEKKIPEYLSHVFHAFDDFKNKFSKCLHCTTTPEEFEIAWIDIMKMYNLEEHIWLRKIYTIREKWIPAYVRTTFCAGMSTTQRSESMNKYFKDYLNSSTPMSVFVTQYDKAVDARYDKVREKDYKTKHSKAILKTLYPMEDEAAKIYTRKIFQKFQEELIQSQKFISEKIEVQDGIHIYKVHLFQRETPTYIVRLNLELKNTTCSCHKFEFMGILCRHVLMIFIKKQIHSLPPCYLLDRWTRYATTKKANDISSAGSLAYNLKSSTIWFNNIMTHSLGLSERATHSEKHYKFTYQKLLQLSKELDELPYEDNDNVCDDQVNESNNDLNSSEQREKFSLLDPPCVATKGRPRSLRMKSGLESSQKVKRSSSLKSKRETKIRKKGKGVR